ncbi:mechanosensitive ion channel family protein [Oceanihabitans sediminis]|uniref:Mechanosensitive ion channel protein MscS n=1 Tax=Oceanihabitans sediminis TaxID=1812012 RepID=A0A368P455_9FLAO|nr:mechanosensitive ion channel domain-containing protein [Oceanihabitans sediminis]MDX1278145.1 mechanosensitive ion channel [Oceanihabitans sediminis]MDX1774068.1 mechanosensitive ion channel [Oceanihabitans sediminis]RBP30891.1 mechanosensitive ion channel-like protein [Oceanihabitans sediminis]RCU56854.1 mechanosensitive ion channel protein MscS [Oceanihabitans sediminis]
MEEILNLINKSFKITENIEISVADIIILIVVLILTSLVLKMLRKIITRKLPYDDRLKFKAVFSYVKWFSYVLIVILTLNAVGVNLNPIFAASAALLIGVGLALQTLFQDIISGIFILTDQTVHVGDIIELDGKVGRVEEIKLRTTRATTKDNKVLIIPNHLYLTNSLYNWTQNGTTTRESVAVGVAYGSDIKLVERLLLQVAEGHELILEDPAPKVLFTNFGASSLDFVVVFTLNDSFNARFVQSDVRFEIDKLFRENNISIPFPQRDIHIIENKK